MLSTNTMESADSQSIEKDKKTVKWIAVLALLVGEFFCDLRLQYLITSIFVFGSDVCNQRRQTAGLFKTFFTVLKLSSKTHRQNVRGRLRNILLKQHTFKTCLQWWGDRWLLQNQLRPFSQRERGNNGSSHFWKVIVFMPGKVWGNAYLFEVWCVLRKIGSI